MKDITDLKQQLTEVLLKDEIVVDDIYTEKKGNYTFLTIVLDRIGGMDLDSIVAATDIINPIVDEYDICDDSYILDVISKERGN